MKVKVELSHKTDNVNSAELFSVKGVSYLLASRRKLEDGRSVFVGVRKGFVHVFLSDELDCLGISVGDEVFLRLAGSRFRAKVLRIEHGLDLFDSSFDDVRFVIRVVDSSYSSPVKVLTLPRFRFFTTQEFSI